MPAFSEKLAELDSTLSLVASVGLPLQWLLLVLAGGLVAVAFLPALATWRKHALALTVAVLAAGEALLAWMHWRLWELSALVDPFTGATSGNVAVPLWVESEKLYVWALVLAVMALVAQRHAEEIFPAVAVTIAVLLAGAALWGQPFTQPLPDFTAQLRAFLAAGSSGNLQEYVGLYQALEGSRRYFYNTWYMWVHPPLLFFSYGAFAMSFAATVEMLRRRHSAFEETAYRWARLGYLPLTFGMLLGFPWAILAWKGQPWWWSGKVNMSIMMWVLYTAYLHARLYLRKRGMWRLVGGVSVLSFVVLVLTYLATYIVPGAHSYG